MEVACGHVNFQTCLSATTIPWNTVDSGYLSKPSERELAVGSQDHGTGIEHEITRIEH